ncbi:Mce protein [Mycolicibacterium sp. 050158]|uniref:Mce protein n=1 Tax=Mycolicibacterium sp. 050158 TaxID=3090602 RepID=UPI00299D3AE8|nr:Mce protein [Mycolicibacterium sp. 050158]MDX1888948.1 Mce protein [Mycolicibacterium sp. 050158]
MTISIATTQVTPNSEPPVSGDGAADADAAAAIDSAVGDARTGASDTVDENGAVGTRSRWRPRATPPRIALVLGLTAAVALAVVIGLLGVREHHAQQSADLRAQYLQVGRQGAVNLTTIDWHHAEADVQRILDVATGPFYDDFSQRSQPFVDVVKKVQSVSTGTVTVAGLESVTDDGARVLVAVNVQTTTNEAPQESSRSWRMRISVQRTGNDVKVSNVEFVP